MRYRKKPIEVEAIQWTGENAIDVAIFCEELLPEDGIGQRLFHDPRTTFFIIRTLEGDMEVSKGDWIIKGVKGEFYPCKPDIFQLTYEPVE